MKKQTKTIILTAILVSLFMGSTTLAFQTLFKDTKVAEIGPSYNHIEVFKFVDTTASTTCYVSKYKATGVHAISCVN